MRKSLIMWLGAGIALSSAFVALDGVARVTKLVTTSGLKASESRVERNAATSSQSGNPVKQGSFYSPIPASSKVGAKIRRTAGDLPTTTLKATTQLIGYLNADADGLTSSTFYTIPVTENTAAADFKVKAKYSNVGALVAGAYYNVENFTVVAPTGYFSKPLPDIYPNWENYSFNDIRKFDLENQKVQVNDNMYSFDGAYVVGGVASDVANPGKAYGFYGYNDYNSDDWTVTRWRWACVDFDGLMASQSSCTAYVEAIDDRISEAEKCYLLCCDNNGQFYGINRNGELRSIDKNTGDQTVIGQTKVDVEKEKGGATFNPNTGNMVVYTINGDNSGSTLYEVDLKTGNTYVAATYSSCWDFEHLVIFPSLAEDKAPNTPSLHITAPTGSRTIEYVVEIPSTLYDGSSLEGTVDWELTANGKVIVSGKNVASASVGGTYTFATEDCGQVEFILTAKNDAGTSTKAKTSAFVGPGLPKALSDIFAIHNNGKVVIKWAKPKSSDKSADGGPLDIENMEYEIADVNGNVKAKVKTSDCTEIAGTYSTTYLCTSFDEPYASEDPLVLKYTITTINNGRKGAASKDIDVPVGVRATPYVAPDMEAMASLGEAGWAQPVSNFGNWYKGSDSPAINVYSNVDAWVFLPALRLVGGGKIHNIDFDINGSNNKMVPLEIYVGKDNTPEAMTTQVMELTGVAPVKYGQYTHHTKGISVAEDGVYYIGFHVKSGNAGNWISLDNLTVSDGFYGDAPAKYAIKSITRDAEGYNKFTASVQLPFFTTSGEEMTESFSTEVLVDGEVVKTYTNSEPGEVCSFEGTVKAAGEHTVAVRGVRNGHAGPEATMKAYVGPLAFEAPTNVNIFPGSPDGNVTLSWSPVANDIEGVAQPFGSAKYMVYAFTADSYGNITVGEPMLKEPVSSTYATFQAVAPGDQKYVQYIVGAFNRDVEPTQFTGSPAIPAGTPYPLQVSISNDKDLKKFIASTERYLPGASSAVTSQDVYFTLVADGQFTDVSSSDEDGVFFASYSKYGGYGNDFITGVIDLKNVTNPQLLIDVNKLLAEDQNVLQIFARFDGNDELVLSTDKKNLPVGWNTLTVDLKPYIGRNVQIVVRNIVKTHTFSLFDNIRVLDRKNLNVGVTRISAPKSTNTGNEFNVTAKVENIGIQNVKNLEVKLLRDGTEIDNTTIESLDALKTANVVFKTKIDLFDEHSDKATYTVQVVLPGDEDATNDISDDVTVERKIYSLPVVDDLSAEKAGEDVNLTWTTYSHDSSVAVPVTEGFEGEVVSFGDNEFDEWTFVDRDGNPVGGLYINNTELEIPNHRGMQDPGSFFIWDWDDPRIPASAALFAAHSGSKMLVSEYTISVDQESGSVYTEKSDDWAISPLLSGNKQTITFQARPFEVHSQEILEVYYSTEDSTNPDNFTQVGEAIKLKVNGNMLSNEGDWEEISFEVPEGAKRFAIRVVSKSGFVCCIDDVEFESAGGKHHELLGYDVYKNGVMLSEDAVMEGKFTDKKVAEGNHTYHVVANYMAGRSELSNPATVSVSSVFELAAEGVSVDVDGNVIVIEALDNYKVNVVATDGCIVYTGEGSAKVEVIPGVYVVKVGKLVVKVLVK